MACLLALSLVALQNDPAPKDTSVTEALEKFKTAYKAKSPADRVLAVTELAKTPHEKITAKLGALLVVDDMTVRIAAAKGLSTTTGENQKKALNFLSRAFPANAGAPLFRRRWWRPWKRCRTAWATRSSRQTCDRRIP